MVMTLPVTQSEKEAMEGVGGGGSREHGEEASAVVRVGSGVARPGWGLWGDKWSDSGDAVRVQPMELPENGDGYERKREAKVNGKELPGRVEVPQVICSNTDRTSAGTWDLGTYCVLLTCTTHRALSLDPVYRCG